MNRHNHVFFGNVDGDKIDDIRVDFELTEVNIRIAQLAA